ncbi:MAG: cobalamin B12-binding domain-containing protein [Thermodesulfobacteriota bacterium]
MTTDSVDSVDPLRALETAIADHDSDLLHAGLEALARGEISLEAALEALTGGLRTARERLAAVAGPIVELLLSVDLLNQGLEKVKGVLPPASKGRVVIGVVQGDVHDLGKNIVAGVLAAAGYEVIDLGFDVACDDFMAALARTGAEILALSAMMSTPLVYMRDTIARCRREMPHVRIMVGGAPLDAGLAEQMGADAYAESAVFLLPALERIEGKPPSRRGSVYTDFERRVKGVTLTNCPET